MASLFLLPRLGAPITAASSLLIPSDGDRFEITGTGTITTLETNDRGPGSRFYLSFADAVTLTHGSGLALRAATNYTTAPGDTLAFEVAADDQVRQLVLANNGGSGGGSGEGAGLAFGFFGVDENVRLGLQNGEAVADVPLPISTTGSLRALMHCDGENNSHTATDDLGHAVSFHGTAKLSTAQKKFGSASLVCGPGTGNYVALDDATDLELGSADFTIEAWFRFNQVDIGQQPLLCKPGPSDGQGWTMVIEWDNSLAFYFSNTGSGWSGSVGGVFYPAADTWYHLAAVRRGSVLTLYANGTAAGSTSISGTIQNTANGIRLGNYPHYSGSAQGLDGYIDEFRLTIGQARYTGAFTPPSAPFSAADGASLKTSWRHALETVFPGTSAAVLADLPAEAPFTGLITALRSAPGPAPQLIEGEVRLLEADGTLTYNGVSLVPGTSIQSLQDAIRSGGDETDADILLDPSSISLPLAGGPDENFALGKPVTQINGGYYGDIEHPEWATDGDISTNYFHLEGGGVIEIDLGVPLTIDNIRVVQGTGGDGNTNTVWTSATGAFEGEEETWPTADGTGIGGGPVLLTNTFPGGTTARYIRVTVAQIIWELEAYNSAAEIDFPGRLELTARFAPSLGTIPTPATSGGTSTVITPAGTPAENTTVTAF